MTDAPDSTAPQGTEAFDQLISLLTDIRDGYVLNAERFSDPVEIAEAYRYVWQALSAASELFVEGQPDHPHFVSIVSPERKMQGDNPDAIYHFTRINGAHSYRVTGRMISECYTSFTVHGQAVDGGMAGPLLGDVNDRDFDVAADGTYEVVFSADRHDGNWVELHPDAHALIVRSYYELEVSAQNDPSVHVTIDIDTIDDVAAPPPLNDATIASRMAEAVAFLRQVTVGQGLPLTSSGVPFVSDTPNQLPVPFSFRDSGLPVPGAADIFYSMGRFDLEPGDVLEMTGKIPAGAFANVMLWNAHMQTLDYRNRVSALNAEQIKLEDDGSYRILIGDRDAHNAEASKAANWLDTAGHNRGSIFWRFLLPDTDPEQPILTKLKL